MDYFVSRLRDLPSFLPSLDEMISNFPLLILFMWTGFLFSILVYFKGGVRDLEEKMGKGSLTRLHVFLIVSAVISFISMVTLAFYLILRPH